MHDGLNTGIVIAALVLALLGLIATLVRRPLGITHLVGAAGVEIAVLVQAILAVVGLAGGSGEVNGLALFIAYLVFAIVVLPVGTLWALGEPNRWRAQGASAAKNQWSGAVLAVASLALVVTLTRLDAVWSTPSG